MAEVCVCGGGRVKEVVVVEVGVVKEVGSGGGGKWKGGWLACLKLLCNKILCILVVVVI